MINLIRSAFSNQFFLTWGYEILTVINKENMYNQGGSYSCHMVRFYSETRVYYQWRKLLAEAQFSCVKNRWRR